MNEHGGEPAISEPDFTIAHYGNVVAITPMSAKANEAVAQGAFSFERWRVGAGSIFVDRRTADEIITNLRSDGFTVEEEGGGQTCNTLQTD